MMPDTQNILAVFVGRKKMVIIAYRAYSGGLEHSSDFALQANHCTYHLMA